MLELNKDNFEEEVLQSEGFTLVDFWGDSCEPCKALMPDVEALADMYGDKIKFAKLNTTKARRVAISQRVLGLPTLLLYKDGSIVEEITRDQANKEHIETVIKKYL
ncbi:MAG: thiol reductase thioredoxin [Firmicutes bacterium HGW-Firmicutes-18]|jgi:thioredoxin 1|nr:MAG: thiol reductase thioredoxin [Firmicutes bacterium HGW-Firmicutes-18]